MNRRPILCVALLLVSTPCVFADIDAVRQLGLRPNDVSFDNGRIITDAIAAGRINDTLHFPGGIYYHSTPILINRNSIAITGQGFARWNREGVFTVPPTHTLRNGSAVIFIYTGPSDKPAWIISGDGCRIDGINIWRDFYPNKNTTAPQRGGGTAIEFRDWGRHVLTQVGVAGFDVGFHFATSNHNDCNLFESISFNSCRVSVLSREIQASSHDWRGVYINGDGEIVFDVAGGGDWFVRSLVLNEPRLILKGSTGSNTPGFYFDNLKIDNNAAGWRLLELSKGGPLNLHLRGVRGNQATPGERPIVIPKPTFANPPADYQHLDVELWSGGTMWRPKLENVPGPSVRK
jgi:hypothetical protein